MFTIRPILPEDLTTLSSLWLEQTSLFSQVDHRHAPLTDGLERWQAGMGKLLDDSQAVTFVALSEDGSYVGYIIGWEPPVGFINSLDAPIGLIGDLVIDMHRYRGGAARELLSAVRSAFNERGVTRLVALSPSRHVVGQAFWRSMGAVEWMDMFWLR